MLIRFAEDLPIRGGVFSGLPHFKPGQVEDAGRFMTEAPGARYRGVGMPGGGRAILDYGKEGQEYHTNIIPEEEYVQRANDYLDMMYGIVYNQLRHRYYDREKGNAPAPVVFRDPDFWKVLFTRVFEYSTFGLAIPEGIEKGDWQEYKDTYRFEDERQREKDPMHHHRWEGKIQAHVRENWEYAWEHEVNETTDFIDVIYYKKKALESAQDQSSEIAVRWSHELSYSSLLELIGDSTILHRGLEDFEGGRDTTGWTALISTVYAEAYEVIGQEIERIKEEIEEEEYQGPPDEDEEL